MKTAVILLILCLTFTLPTNLAQTWEAMGPEGGSFCEVVVDPTDEDVLTIVGVSPSFPDVYRSNDGGDSWTLIGNVGNGFTVKTVVAFDLDKLYALGYDSSYSYGVSKSTDGGATWTFITIPATEGIPSAICTHPTDINKVYVSGFLFDYGTYTYTGKFWWSADGGNIWNVMDLPDGAYSGAFMEDMCAAPTNPDVIYISGYQFDSSYDYYALVYKSIDGGVNWSDISAQVDPNPDGDKMSIMIDPTDENVIHSGGWSYYHRSVDGGLTWTKYPYQIPNASAIEIDPSNTNNVYLGNGKEFYKSTDKGQTWTIITEGFTGYSGGDITVAPSKPSTIYQVNPFGGNFKSIDYGETWASAYSGILTSSLTVVSTAPSKPELVLATTLVGGQLFGSYDSCETWTKIPYPTGCSVGYFSDITICSTNPDIIMSLAVG